MVICDKNKCSGCAACIAICRHNAITMKLDRDGFLYPIIDMEKCTDCGLCRKGCPQVNLTKENQINSLAYLCWDIKTSSRLASSSGGIFSVIARDILSKGGVVCSAAYDDNMYLRHIIIDNICDLSRLQGSKYMQSDIGHCFVQIKKALKQNKLVYFVGTPCQVAGLKSYLKIDYNNLITSDLICHGVPSTKLFQQQITRLEDKYTSKIVDFKFRSKKRFGQGYDCEIKFRGGDNKFLCAELIPFFYGFWNNFTLRDCCYQCKYASLDRIGDITLGDFWLVKKIFPNIKTSKGISLILINTPKGLEVFDSIKENIYYREVTLEQGAIGQGQLKSPVVRPEKREQYTTCDLDHLEKDLLRIPLTYKCKMHLRNFFKLLLFYKLWK